METRFLEIKLFLEAVCYSAFLGIIKIFFSLAISLYSLIP